MASTGSIAKRKSDAMKRIAEVAADISAVVGVEELALPQYRRDPALEQAMQLESVEAWLRAVKDGLAAKPEQKKKTPKRTAKG